VRQFGHWQIIQRRALSLVSRVFRILYFFLFAALWASLKELWYPGEARYNAPSQFDGLDRVSGGVQDLINMQTHAFAATVPDAVPQRTCSMHQVTKLAPDRMLGLLHAVFGGK